MIEVRHELSYQAGVSGLRGRVDTVPAWYCTCSNWAMVAKADGRTRTGTNEPAARRAFQRHVEAR